MVTEISEKESSSKSRVSRVAGITIVVIAAIAVLICIVALVNHLAQNDRDSQQAITVESLLKESSERGFEPVAGSERSDEKDGQISSLNFDAKVKDDSCYFTMTWTPSERWKLTKPASTLNVGNDFVLSNPDVTTIQRIGDFATCFAQTDEETEPASVN